MPEARDDNQPSFFVDTIDDPVSPKNALANMWVAEFWYHAAGERMRANCFSFVDQAMAKLRCCSRIVGSDEPDDFLQVSK